MGNDKDVLEFSCSVIFLPSIAIPLVQAPATVAQVTGCKRRQFIRTETEISGARFHRAGHVITVPHVQKTTVISAPVLNLAVPKVVGATRHIGGCRIPKLLGMKLEYVAKFCIKNQHEPERQFQRW